VNGELVIERRLSENNKLNQPLRSRIEMIFAQSLDKGRSTIDADSKSVYLILMGDILFRNKKYIFKGIH